MNRGKKLAAYGQEFEDEDDESSIVSKKPTAVQDQIATDENGKRRFHGAFTGGFSAGYWNTVGSKHGWVPQEFSSSRTNRGDKIKQRAEDFMDAEDLGEFGIGNRSIKRTSAFGEGTSRKMAWERDSSTSVTSIAQMFEDIVKPVSDSIGIRMLRSMGWREGKGIGLANISQKKKRNGKGVEADFDREQAQKIAGNYELSNEDVIVKQLTPLTGCHGIGYEGLQHSTVLDERYGQTSAALKTNKKGKGIRGQAFGVGVFEEDDDSVYSNFDLTQFDFSLDVSGRGGDEAAASAKKVDTTFELQPKRLNARKFYAAPRLPPNFRGEHRPILMDISKLPNEMRNDAKNMTAMQRAKFLGEDRISVMELVSSKDRKRLERKSRWDMKSSKNGAENEKIDEKEEAKNRRRRNGETDEERDRRERNRIEFPDEPLKQSRFKEYLHYTRRGLPYPQPTDLSVWEWESEKKEFETKLTVEERAMLPEVRSRAQPLAKASIAAPIHEILASKFVKEASGDLQIGRKDEDKLAAVKMEMFGDRTRSSYQWYPDSLLVKRFNVPNPYPESDLIGVPCLQKSANRKETIMDLGLPKLGLPNTANELEMRERLLKERRKREEINKDENEEEEKNDNDEDDDDGKRKKEKQAGDSSESEDEKTIKEIREKAPKSFFNLVFGGVDDESDTSDDEDEEAEKKREERRKEELKRRQLEIERKEEEKKKDEKVKKGIKKEELKVEKDEDDEIQILEDKNEKNNCEVYGPTVPENLKEATGLTAFSVLKYLQEDLKKRREEKSRKKEKKKEKKKKSKKSSKKEKKKKHKKRKNVTSSSSSTSSEWEEEK